MRISDWSSDVCSSDLLFPGRRTVRLEDDVPRGRVAKFQKFDAIGAGDERIGGVAGDENAVALAQRFIAEAHFAGEDEIEAVGKIGRASCRERGCQYV